MGNLFNRFITWLGKVPAFASQDSGNFVSCGTMKNTFAILALAVLLPAYAIAQDAAPRSFKTKDGQAFDNVTISSVTATEITVATDSGIAHIAAANLPADLYKELGYAKADDDKKEAIAKAQKAHEEQEKQRAIAAEKALDLMPMLDAKDYPAEMKTIIAEHNKQREAMNASLRASGYGTGNRYRLERDAKEYDKYVKFIAGITDAKKLAEIQEEVESGKLYFGMPEEAFRVIKGAPDSVNVSASANSYHEQLVYGSHYYYFDNRIYTSRN